MNVAVNGRFLGQRVTGVERYAREIMARRATQVSVVAPRRPARGLRGHLWEQGVLPARLGRDLLWSPCNTGPLSVANQVVTIHDCAFYDQPEGFSRKFAAWYRWLVPRLARRIRRILTVSAFSRDRLADYCRIAPEKIVVVPHGVDSRFKPLPTDEIESARRRLGLPARYVLFVGNLIPRKNLPRLLEAWQLVAPEFEGLSLILVGATGAVFRNLELASVPRSVVAAGYLGDADLPAVYGGAEVFAFPSLYEGFGLPVLEAMACGVPVLTSNVTALPEAAGDAALLIDPYDVHSIADGLRTLLTTPALRSDLVRRGLARAGQATWERAAETSWSVLHETAAN